MSFIQIIEVTTTHVGEIQEIVDDWIVRTEGKRKSQAAKLTQDRDRPNTYLQIVEFPSFEAAITNAELPETGVFAQQLAVLCDDPPIFRNLEVRHVFDLV